MAEHQALREYRVWDATIRWFHWINVAAVLGLTATGLGIYFDDALEFSTAGKVQLKTVHVLIGYVMAVNLLWRLVWAFIGGPNARWGALLPGGRNWFAAARSYLRGLAGGKEQVYAGHNPLGRLAVAALLLLLTIQAISGLVLAGTDLFYPPFGGTFARQVAAPGTDPESLGPAALVLKQSPQLLDATAFAAMKAMKEIYEGVHEYAFYALLLMMTLHIAGVVLGELRGHGTLISAMFTGRKILRGTPLDAPIAPAAQAPKIKARSVASDASLES
jgi:Ni/Fe-hydrogenase 1 B-type cytochrome subunit